MLNTGFSEITEERAHFKGPGFWYCELALTGECNFSCKYCNRLRSDIDEYAVLNFIDKQKASLRHVQVTGGEPTQSKYLKGICEFIKRRGIKLGLSTNGSAPYALYESLGVDMFSISLDDNDLGNLYSRGYKDVHTIINNIRRLAEKTYVNVGLVVDSLNVDRVEEIIDYILNLGVHDIKLSINTHDEVSPIFGSRDYSKYPILSYRISRFKAGKTMRGLGPADTFKCGISLNDISIVGDSHYPCLVYARERGKAIGPMRGDIAGDRRKWYETHVPLKDSICSKFCMDFKCDFNRALITQHTATAS